MSSVDPSVDCPTTSYTRTPPKRPQVPHLNLHFFTQFKFNPKFGRAPVQCENVRFLMPLVTIKLQDVKLISSIDGSRTIVNFPIYPILFYPLPFYPIYQFNLSFLTVIFLFFSTKIMFMICIRRFQLFVQF